MLNGNRPVRPRHRRQREGDGARSQRMAPPMAAVAMSGKTRATAHAPWLITARPFNRAPKERGRDIRCERLRLQECRRMGPRASPTTARPSGSSRRSPADTPAAATSGTERATSIARWRTSTGRSASIRDMPAAYDAARGGLENSARARPGDDGKQEGVRLQPKNPILDGGSRRPSITRWEKSTSRSRPLRRSARARSDRPRLVYGEPRDHLVQRSANTTARWPTTTGHPARSQGEQDTLRPAAICGARRAIWSAR